MSEVMTKEREGYHNLFVQIPLAIWDALDRDADESGESVTKIVTELLRKRYGISRESLPRPKRAGRPPRRGTA